MSHFNVSDLVCRGKRYLNYLIDVWTVWDVLAVKGKTHHSIATLIKPFSVTFCPVDGDTINREQTPNSIRMFHREIKRISLNKSVLIWIACLSLGKTDTNPQRNLSPTSPQVASSQHQAFRSGPFSWWKLTHLLACQWNSVEWLIWSDPPHPFGPASVLSAPLTFEMYSQLYKKVGPLQPYCPSLWNCHRQLIFFFHLPEKELTACL